MNGRERWIRNMHFQEFDRVPDEEFGYWEETLTRWHDEGLPKEVNTNELADIYFGFDPRPYVPINVILCPSFEPQVIEEDERHQIIIDNEGNKAMINKVELATIPHYIDYGIKSRKDWEEKYKVKLNPYTPERYPDNWDELVREYKNRDYPLTLHVGSMLGTLRNWIGFEYITVMFYDDPDLISEMVDYMADMVIAIIGKALEQVQFDSAHFWEDVAFNAGPMISPAMFREFITPRYKRITDFLKQYGIDVVSVDCDGNINKLIDPWLEGGVNGMFPLEIAGTSDPVTIREKYGREVLLFGGVDKKALIAGKERIRKELKRIAPVVLEGGYIPHVDHRVPPDVSYENYLYYLDMKRDLFGIQKPRYRENWEAYMDK